MNIGITKADICLVELLDRAVRGVDARTSDEAIGTVVAGAPAATRPGRWKGRLNIPDEKVLEPMSGIELADWCGAA
jgi:hypothetical protein